MRSLLGCRFFPFITLSISCHFLLAGSVSVESSAVSLLGITQYVICCFFLDAINICSLWLIFVSLINMYLGVFLLEMILYGTLSFLELGGYSLPHFREVFDYYLSSIFSYPFLLSSSSRIPMIQKLGCLTLLQRSLRLSSFLFIVFFFILLCFIYFHHLLLAHLFILPPQLLYSWFPLRSDQISRSVVSNSL